MKISVILGHPQAGSLNHAIADIVVQTLQDWGIRFIIMIFDDAHLMTRIIRCASSDAHRLSSSTGLVLEDSV